MPPKDKKEKSKEKSAGWDLNPIEGLIVLLFLLAILGSVSTSLFKYIASGNLTFFGFRISGIFNFFKSNALFFKILGFVAAGGAAIGTFLYTKMADRIWHEVKANVYPENIPSISPNTEPPKNEQTGRWEKIVGLSESANPSDWRLAVIEADIMLDELLEKLELPGETMGEKLKAVEQSDFTTIESAWEAHKFRNNIAHEGGDFLVNQREIRRIISLYAAVFKEFSLI